MISRGMMLIDWGASRTSGSRVFSVLIRYFSPVTTIGSEESALSAVAAAALMAVAVVANSASDELAAGDGSFACALVPNRSPEPTMSDAVFRYERMPELGAKRDTGAPLDEV